MDRSAATVRAPIGPAPMTMAVSPGATPDRVIPCMATARGSASAAWRAERLSGKRKTPAARTRMYSANAPSPLSVMGLLRFSHCEGFPSSQRRQVPHLGEEPPTTRLAQGPGVDIVTGRGDGPGPLVSGNGPGLEAPPVTQLMDVRAADTAVMHPDQDLIGTGLGYRSILDGDDAGRLIDRRRHDIGKWSGSWVL